MIFVQFNDRFLPVRSSAIAELVPTHLALTGLRPDFLNLDIRQLLHCSLDIKVCRFAMNLECVLIIA